MIRIITIADENFDGLARLTTAKNAEFGYANSWCFPIPTPVKIKIGDWSARCPWKPSVLLDCMQRNPNDTLLYLDADAWLIRRVDELESDDYDVAVTMRRQQARDGLWPEIFSFLNSGVFVARPTAAALEFVKAWEVEIGRCVSGSCQHALNNLVRQATDLTEYNKVFIWRGIRIKILACDEYNWIYAPEEPLPTTKIIHMKEDVRKRVDMSAWLAREFL